MSSAILQPIFRRCGRCVVAAASVVVLAGGAGLAPASAAGPVCDNSWTNAAGGPWSTGSNWSGGLPSATQSVCITIATSAPVTASNVTVAGLTVGGTGTSTATELDVNGTTTINGSATVTDAGKLVAQNTLDLTAGTLTLDGRFVTSANLKIEGAGNVENGADGFFSDTAQLLLPGPGGFTNDGELVVSTGASLYADPTSPTTETFDNDGGILASVGGGVQIMSDATFVEGAGQTTGNYTGAGAAVLVNGGTLDLTGGGASSFVLGNGTLEGTIAADQTVLFQGTDTTSGPVTNRGELVGPLGGTFTIASGQTLTNDGLFGVRAASTTLVGSFDNAADGTFALPSGQIVLQPPYDLTNDGTISLAPQSSLIATDTPSGPTATIDNDGGTISNGTTTTGGNALLVDSGATFVEGSGTTTGYPIDVEGTLDLSGAGASSFQLVSGTLEGNVAAGQSVLFTGTDSAPSFDNAGTVTFTSAVVNLPAGGTVTNDGDMGDTASLAEINGNVTNAPDGVLDVASQLQITASSGTLDNQGELYLLGQDSIYLTPGAAFTNEGDLKFGVLEGSWGSFGLHATIQTNGSPPQTILLGGSVEPVFPQGYLPPQWVTPEPTSILYGMAIAPSTNGNPPLDDISCGATTPADFELTCTDNGGLSAIVGYLVYPDNVPTTVSVASSASASTVICGSSCPTSADGQPVTLTATVTPEYGSTAPTGTATFFDGAIPIGTGTLSTSSGVTTATLTPTSLTPGIHEFSAVYAGDSNDIAGNSTPVEEGVTQEPTTATLSPSPDPSTFGQPVTLTAAVTPAAAGVQSPTGGVVFMSGNYVLGIAPVTTSGGASSASLTTSALPIGLSDPITATYSGDANYAAPSAAGSSTASVGATTAPTTVTVTGPAVADPGTTYSATASADGSTPTLFALAAAPAAPSGLTVDPATGAVSYAVPAPGGTSFSYAVVALNTAGRAESTVVSVAVPETQTITFSAPSGGVVNGSAMLSPAASSGLGVTLTVDSATSPSGACTLSGPTAGNWSVAYVHAGSCVIDANQAGNASFAAAPRVQRTIAVRKVSQVVTFAAIAKKTMLQSPVKVKAKASSGLAVTFTSTTPTVCTSGGSHGATITLLAPGTCSVKASQTGNAIYAAAVAVVRSFPVRKASQIVTFAAISKKTITQSPVKVKAKASSGLAVTFTSTTPTVCTSGGSHGATITLLAPGTCSVKASQTGNARYAAATAVVRSFAVTP